VLTLFPDFRIKIAEDTCAIRSPAPPVVPRESFKWEQWRGKSSGLRHTLFRFSAFNHSGSFAAVKLESLLEFLVVEKYARVGLREKDQPHFLDLPVFRKKLLDSFG